mgnify:CR=1 FL=1
MASCAESISLIALILSKVISCHIHNISAGGHNSCPLHTARYHLAPFRSIKTINKPLDLQKKSQEYKNLPCRRATEPA